MKVNFVEVGRMKRSWTEEAPCVTRRTLIRSIKKRGALMSRDIDIGLNDTGTAGIVIVGGMRSVGKFFIEGGAIAGELTLVMGERKG